MRSARLAIGLSALMATMAPAAAVADDDAYREIALQGNFALSVKSGHCLLDTEGNAPRMILMSGESGNRLIVSMKSGKWPVTSETARIFFGFAPGGAALDMSGGALLEDGEIYAVVLIGEDASEFLSALSEAQRLEAVVDSTLVQTLPLTDAADAVAAFRTCHSDQTGIDL